MQPYHHSIEDYYIKIKGDWIPFCKVTEEEKANLSARSFDSLVEATPENLGLHRDKSLNIVKLVATDYGDFNINRFNNLRVTNIDYK